MDFSPVSLLWPKMCLSIPSSPLSLCSTSSPIPKPSVPPIFKSCIQEGINVRDFSPFGMFVHYNTLYFIKLRNRPWKSSPRIVTFANLKAAWGLGAHETTERRKNPHERTTSWRATREKLRLPLPRPFLAPCPQYLNLIQGKREILFFAPLFLFKTPEWRSSYTYIFRFFLIVTGHEVDTVVIFVPVLTNVLLETCLWFLHFCWKLVVFVLLWPLWPFFAVYSIVSVWWLIVVLVGGFAFVVALVLIEKFFNNIIVSVYDSGWSPFPHFSQELLLSRQATSESSLTRSKCHNC